MFKCYVRPIGLLKHGCIIFSPHCNYLTGLIEHVKRNFTKRLYGLKYKSYNDELNKCGLETLEYRRVHNDLIFRRVHNDLIFRRVHNDLIFRRVHNDLIFRRVHNDLIFRRVHNDLIFRRVHNDLIFLYKILSDLVLVNFDNDLNMCSCVRPKFFAQVVICINLKKQCFYLDRRKHFLRVVLSMPRNY